MDETISVRRLTPFQWFTQALLVVGAGIMLLPFIYMIGTSFKPPTEVLTWPPTLFAVHPTWDNYRNLTTIAPFPRFFLNSLIMSTASTLGILATSTFAGYIFSKYRFPGRDLLFIIILATAMVPFETYLIPFYFLDQAAQADQHLCGDGWPVSDHELRHLPDAPEHELLDPG